MQNYLRQEVKIIKALQNISYKELAEYIEISKGAFYNWMGEQYELSKEKEIKLKEILDLIKEV